MARGRPASGQSQPRKRSRKPAKNKLPPSAAIEAGPLTLAELRRRLADPAIDLRSLEPYLAVTPDPRTGALKLVPNPAVIAASDEDVELRTRGLNVIDVLNGAARTRRRLAFEASLGSGKPILLAEGDSWFEYPVFLDDTIDALARTYNPFCLSAAGDTMASMAGNGEVVESFLQLVRRRRLKVEAILLSAGGNDIVGDTLVGCVKLFTAGASAKDLIDMAAFEAVLDGVFGKYRQAVRKIRRINPAIPILVHGYDHAIPVNAPLPPHPWDNDLIRRHAPRDGWLARPLSSRKIVDSLLQSGIVALMIDAFYRRLEALADPKGPDGFQAVHLVDNRGVVGNRWNDELHPDDAGFADVAANFDSVLRKL